MGESCAARLSEEPTTGQSHYARQKGLVSTCTSSCSSGMQLTSVVELRAIYLCGQPLRLQSRARIITSSPEP